MNKLLLIPLLVHLSLPLAAEEKKGIQLLPKISASDFGTSHADAAKKGWRVEPEKILSERNFLQQGRKITIRQIAPIPLPPPPKEQPIPLLTADLAKRVLLRADKLPGQSIVILGATVYLMEDGTARSHCQVVGQQKGEPISFWSSFDFSLLSGVGEFAGKDGGNRALFLLVTVVDTSRRNRTEAYDGSEILPEIPEFASKQPYVFGGGSPDAELLAALEDLHMLLKREGAKLRIARDKRERDYRAQDVWEKSQPPRSKDIIIHHWQIQRTEGGGR